MEKEKNAGYKNKELVFKYDYHNSDKKPQETKEASAFNHEFYKIATDKQIEDDVISYLGEYRFEVSEFDYELTIKRGKLLDPASEESMVSKSQRAIDMRRNEGLSISREIAEKKGLEILEKDLDKEGTVVWFSPPGPKEEGYGDYGFAYLGEKKGDKLKMTAIRIEKPSLSDFNHAKDALWGGDTYVSAENFLSSPKIVNINKVKLKEFIHGNFEIKDGSEKKVFDKVKERLKGVIDEYKQVVHEGINDKAHQALHVIENLSIELKKRYEQEFSSGEFLITDNLPNLSQAMDMKQYRIPPVAVKGSCGISGGSTSNDIFRDINVSADKTPTSNAKREWDFDNSGPCIMCEKDVPCGPCKICEACNNKIDEGIVGE